jgi:Spy/CpxP family protein refolding chaperone
MNNRKITNILLLVLLVFNIGFLGAWWFGHWKAHHPRYGHYMAQESKGAMFLAKELNFDQGQQTELDALRKAHFQKIRMLENAVARNEKNMMDAIMANPIDSLRANTYADSIGILKAAVQKELFRHFCSIKKICNPDQSRKFDELMGEMSKEFPHHWEAQKGANEAHHDTM